ncbi:septal ring lytic transglycosylase RlpA family lipoprotein [Bordetella genomosp. 5]|uniref:Endolytic peptidoglycan transglycosylase RlpA n=1 Tax=Bordetella genomosp. 5 TaxID=1395608 RepID=A0A261U193_9BORD|nr:septal ring lytic transglycosylase RlpA family protein [Bordetella genomosp. 5]OZI47471.1 septal ring lytic transglycosylase RlpA family lipoprotein [Bordetella genomosp. 5]OZI55405.1 septal ring lytic transglycosylase RlpA family lipoprotein [Bordetella genomosp. 5]
MTLPRPLTLLTILMLAIAVAGCSSPGKKRGGGYYKDDGPGSSPPADIEAIPDAQPRIEPLASGANRPYVVFGKRYVPDTTEKPFRQQGVASWYGKKFHGNSTSIGESYDMYAMTAAHPTMPLPSYARVTSKLNGRTVIVRVNDRGPFHDNRIMDLSYVAAYKLGIIGPGSGAVTVERILPDEIRTLMAQGGAPAPAPRPDSATGTIVSSPVDLGGGSALAATPLSAQPVSSAPPAAQAGGIYLQLGAFSQPANAHTLVARVNGLLAAEGAPPAIVEQANNMYRVRMGPYSDRDAALSAVQRVSDRTGIMPSLAAP